MNFWHPQTERGPFLKCSVRSRCRDKLCYFGLPRMSSSIAPSTLVQKLTTADNLRFLHLCWLVLFPPYSAVASQPRREQSCSEDKSIAKKNSSTAEPQFFSLKVKCYITITLVSKRRARPFATFSFLCYPFNPWFLWWSGFLPYINCSQPQL